ncbi:hypothetical protein PTKIN_Ptkin05aG0119600 [Pterospermum kingtungense]
MGSKKLSWYNSVMLCKLGWNMASSSNLVFAFLRGRFFIAPNVPRCSYLSSIIWLSIKYCYATIIANSQWMPSAASRSNFWLDNWLGYSIADKLEISHKDRKKLKTRIGDVFYDNVWHLSDGFASSHPEIAQDILQMVLRRRMKICWVLWVALASLFNVHLDISLDFNIFYKEVATMSFSSQLEVLWKAGFHAVLWSIWHARNVAHFHGQSVIISHSLRTVCKAIKEMALFKLGYMHNSIEDLMVLRRFGIAGVPRKPRVIIPILWIHPPLGCVKINIDGAAAGSPAAPVAWSIFWGSTELILASFSAPLGIRERFCSGGTTDSNTQLPCVMEPPANW